MRKRRARLQFFSGPKDVVKGPVTRMCGPPASFRGGLRLSLFNILLLNLVLGDLVVLCFSASPLHLPHAQNIGSPLARDETRKYRPDPSRAAKTFDGPSRTGRASGNSLAQDSSQDGSSAWTRPETAGSISIAKGRREESKSGIPGAGFTRGTEKQSVDTQFPSPDAGTSSLQAELGKMANEWMSARTMNKDEKKVEDFQHNIDELIDR
jgi:hypothetical protein